MGNQTKLNTAGCKQIPIYSYLVFGSFFVLIDGTTTQHTHTQNNYSFPLATRARSFCVNSNLLFESPANVAITWILPLSLFQFVEQMKILHI